MFTYNNRFEWDAPFSRAPETLVAEKIVFGVPPNRGVYYFTMSFHHDGVLDKVAKFASRPGIVIDVRTCKEQSEADYNASHEADVATIDQENTTRLPWHPGD